MTLQSSGAISISQINAEFGRGNNLNSYRGTTWYTDAGSSGTFSSGAITMSDFYGKRATAPNFSATITTNQQELNLRAWAVSAGWNQSQAAVITINSGVYIWSNNNATPALTIDGSWPGGLTVINNGYVMGKGGNGGWNATTGAQSGGKAINCLVGCTITNNSYIGGGGGGGVGGVAGSSYAGGGGAGGGNGGGFSGYSGSSYGLGGSVGTSGTNGNGGANNVAGGGGRIMPGTGGAGGATSGSGGNPYASYSYSFGYGGGAGGGGSAVSKIYAVTAGSGGSGGNPGGNGPVSGGGGGDGCGGGGGGGWGASGGSAASGGVGVAGTGGAAISKNGFTVTVNNNLSIYGSVA